MSNINFAYRDAGYHREHHVKNDGMWFACLLKLLPVVMCYFVDADSEALDLHISWCYSFVNLGLRRRLRRGRGRRRGRVVAVVRLIPLPISTRVSC